MKPWTTTMLIGALALLAPALSRAAETNATPSKATTDAIELFKKTDPKMTNLFTTASGYAVFPGVTKGAAGIGAAHGAGEVFAKGKLIGSATMTQVTLGFQLGGQEFAEVIFFETKDTLDKFASSQWAMSAQATAVAAADGAAANAKYQQGVLVFTVAKGGLMFEASIGGQKFKFTPLKKVPLY